MREAAFYERREQNTVWCRLCPRACVIKEGQTGFCRVRENREGVLYALTYGQCAAYAVDPIEKKPLYHFYPGHTILSLGTIGCNLRCRFCQNWELAHGAPPVMPLAPEEVVAAVKAQGDRCIGVAYTYSEPTVWYEFILDTARLVRKAGFKNVLVTNGYIKPEPLEELLPLVDAWNIDVKSFREEFYRETCAGRLAPVLKTVERAHGRCHVEITTLLVTGLNDTPAELADLGRWLAELDPDVPWHLSRYFPHFEMKQPPTPLPVLSRAYEIARRWLRYVYLGNVREKEVNNTYCPSCGTVVLEREGYQTRPKAFRNGECAVCGTRIPVVGTVWEG